MNYFEDPTPISDRVWKMPTSDWAEAGLWGIKDKHLDLKYHRDPRVGAGTHTLTFAEVQLAQRGLDVVYAAIGSPGQAWGIAAALAVGEGLITDIYFRDHGIGEGNDQFAIYRVGAKDMTMGWYNYYDGVKTYTQKFGYPGW